ncbi:MAG: glycogen/starch synthase [Deltaproteobacteria bacterium]|nr:glycogen/starch synthase [Deltaproteobacteria bacterium]
MRIVLVAPEFEPFTGISERGTDIGQLAAALVAEGHEVRAVVPWPSGADPAAHSLARRLMPVRFEADGETLSWTRYDGRAASGVGVDLLELDRPWLRPGSAVDGRFWPAFSRAAVEILSSLPAPPSFCMCFDAETSMVPTLAKEGSSAVSECPHVLAVMRLDGESRDLDAGLLVADRVAVAGRPLADRAVAERAEPLASMILDGRAVVMPLAAPKAAKATIASKADAKAAFAARHGLAIRPDAPLIAFVEEGTPLARDILVRILRADVQVGWRTADADASLSALAERYPDRLALVEGDEPLFRLLFAADSCMVLHDPRLVPAALAHGTVPLVAPECAGDAVDLEPSLESGSAVVLAGRSADAAWEGLGRLLAAYKAGAAFRATQERIKGYAATARDLARRHVVMVCEGPTEI